MILVTSLLILAAMSNAPFTPPTLPTYTFTSAMRREARTRIVEQLGRLTILPDVDKSVLPEVVAHSQRLITALDGPEGKRLSAYASFLPPRIVAACRDASLIPFFGSGISIPAGIPSWAGLLERLGLSDGLHF